MLTGSRLQTTLILSGFAAALVLNTSCARNRRKSDVSEHKQPSVVGAAEIGLAAGKKHLTIRNATVAFDLHAEPEAANSNELAVSRVNQELNTNGVQFNGKEVNILPSTIAVLSNFSSPALWLNDFLAGADPNQLLSSSELSGSASASVGGGSAESSKGGSGSSGMASGFAGGTPGAPSSSASGQIQSSRSAVTASASDGPQAISSSEITSGVAFQSLTTKSSGAVSSGALYSSDPATSTIASNSNAYLSPNTYVQSANIAGTTGTINFPSALSLGTVGSTDTVASYGSSKAGTSTAATVTNSSAAAAPIKPPSGGGPALSEVPEPSTLLLALAGLGAMVLSKRKGNPLT